MDILDVQNRLALDSNVWNEIKNDDIVLSMAVGKANDSFSSPLIVYYILNNREDVNSDILTI